MTVVPLRQRHSFRPIVRPVLLDLLHLLRSARGALVGLLHFFGQWVDDLGALDAWDAALGAGGVPAADRLFPASHSTYVFGPW